ncbi:MAG: homocysteine S-methyltransferase family protein [Chloroflexi bacterium]|nr:homocysteine S-methyltransferase family protein [Chloroflexota bacterium]
MTHPLLARLDAGETLISDGATGTYLQQHGLAPGGCPEEFNLTHPEVVREMAAAYFAAGSDMVLTNSFGGNVFRLRHYGYGDRVRELNRLGVAHARSVAPPGRFVVGSIGPTGEFLEPLGDVSVAEMAAVFAEQAEALEEGGADAILVETMISLEEATLAVRVARERTNCVVIATMVFDKGPRGYFTMMGNTPEQAARELLDAGAHVVGSNCGNGIAQMVEIARQLREATDAPLLIHSNAGIPRIREGQLLYPETPEMMAPFFLELEQVGINIIGGCCGTNPDHIRALAHTLNRDPVAG